MSQNSKTTVQEVLLVFPIAAERPSSVAAASDVTAKRHRPLPAVHSSARLDAGEIYHGEKFSYNAGSLDLRVGLEPVA